MLENNDTLDSSEEQLENSLENSVKMTKNWRELEILIGITLSISSFFILYQAYLVLIFYVDLFERFSKSHLNGSSWFQIVKNCYLIFIIGFMMLIGGVFLIFEKKFAWIFSILSCTLGLLFLLVALFKTEKMDSAYNWIIYAFVIFFLLVLTALLCRPFRAKYMST